MKRWIGIFLILLLTLGCSPGLSKKDPVPEPVPDHGPSAASAQLRTVMISWDVYIRDSNGVEGTVGVEAGLAVILTCTLGGNAKIRRPDGTFMVFPWGDTIIIPYDFTIYVEPGAVILLKCTGTLVFPRPGYRFECVSRVDGAVVDRNPATVDPVTRLIKPISCVVHGVG